MPAGVRVELEYDHSAMPFGVAEKDLQIFQLEGDTYIPLSSRVQINKMCVSADVFCTGEFALGAYDIDGNLHLVEGEFGIRAENMINPKQGGDIKLGGGSYLKIPPKVLSERTLIGIIATRETVRDKSDSKAFTFTPHGTEFSKPVLLVLSRKEFAGTSITLYYFNEITNEWESGEGVWDENDRSVTLELYHFSRYALAHS